MDYEIYLKFVASLAFVILLFAAIVVVLRHFGVGGGVTRASFRRRLAIVEVQALDGRRRLVLVRRDDVEHLLLLGAAGDLVVESGVPARPSFRDALAPPPTPPPPTPPPPAPTTGEPA